MDLMILKRKLDGFRTSSGSIRDVSPEVLWELRTAWENFAGPIEEFRSKLGIHTGTLRALLILAKKLNHAMASAQSIAVSEAIGDSTSTPSQSPSQNRSLELVYDRGEKVIRFPDVETLIDFLRRAA